MLTIHRSRSGWCVRVSQLSTAFFVAIFGALLLSVALLGVALPSQVAHAESGSAQFSIRPVASGATTSASAPYFVFNLQLGATIQGQVRITNTGTARGSVALYAVDATTGQTSGVVYRSQDDPRTDVGAWVMVGTRQLTLDPQQSQVVPFTVIVPASARPGQHVGGLVAQNLALQNGSGSSVQITIQHQSIVAVQVNLPGPQTQRLDATGIQAGGQQSYQALFLSLRNAGTQMLKPSGTLRITDMAGHQLKQMPLALDTVLPQTALDYPVYVSGQALGPGQYQGVLSLTYGNPRQTLNRTFTFTVTTADMRQVFGSQASTLPAPASVGSPALLVILAAAGGAAVLLLAGLGAGLFFVPALRARVPFRKR